MGRALIKIKDRYFEWSSIVDAPISYGMTEEELRQYTGWQYGENGLRELPARLQRCELFGTSAQGYTLAEILAGNRAGPNETRLTADEIYDQYTEPVDEPQDASVRRHSGGDIAG